MALLDITPIMTSNTTPTPYAVNASSIYNDTYPAYKAFNGTTSDSNDAWLANGTTGAIIFDFGVSTSVKAFAITSRIESSGYSTTAPKTFVLYGSNTSTTSGFELLYKGVSEILWNSAESRLFKLDNTYSFRYYKLVITENNGHAQATGLGLLKFYQDDGTTPTINSTHITQRRGLPYGSKARLDSITSDLVYMLATENDGDNMGTLRIVNHAGKFINAKAAQKREIIWEGNSTTGDFIKPLNKFDHIILVFGSPLSPSTLNELTIHKEGVYEYSFSTADSSSNGLYTSWIITNTSFSRSSIFSSNSSWTGNIVVKTVYGIY